MSTPFAKDIEYQGLPAIHLCTPAGAEAIVLLYGGHLVSWKPAGGEERIFLSDKAVFAAGTPIRGGVPVCFPQFGTNGPLPQHGFARIKMWEKVSARTSDDFAIATLRLCDDDDTRAMWPHPFKVELTISITQNRLDIEFDLENTGSTPLEFVLALHTYLQVKEVEEVALEGLYGRRYRNLLNKTEVEERVDTGVALSIDRETTRLYYDAKKPILLRENGRSMGINSENLPDNVIWNPWEQTCANISDMPANGFRHMLCVEAAAIKDPVQVKPAESWWGRQSLVAI
jgi:glucose-6-phosphate 1-epimerase